jgi:hypothetical protein
LPKLFKIGFPFYITNKTILILFTLCGCSADPMKSVENLISWLMTAVMAQMVASLDASPAKTLPGYSFSLITPGFMLISFILFQERSLDSKVRKELLVDASTKLYLSV